MNEEMCLILDAMEEWGGSFVKALANLYRHADPMNKKILETSFKNYFDDYREKAEHIRQEKKQHGH